MTAIGERVVTWVATKASPLARSVGGKTSTWFVASFNQDWTEGPGRVVHAQQFLQDLGIVRQPLPVTDAHKLAVPRNRPAERRPQLVPFHTHRMDPSARPARKPSLNRPRRSGNGPSGS